MKYHILFVDDEPKVLDGMRRMLAGMRREWIMSFAEDGPAALEIMAAQPVDVIVTDMRMPGMDGAELLQKVQERHPEAVRLVLSGYTEKRFLGRAFPPSHQFLSKPCSRDLLVSTIRNALQSRELLASAGLRALVGSITRLPTLPEIFREISQELARDEPSIEKLGAVVNKDVAMTARLLKLVNSPFFGVSHKILNPVQAVNLVGINYLQSLVMVFATFDECDVSIPGYSLRRLLEHSLRISCVAGRIADLERAAQDVRDACLTAGLLHDVGKLVLASNLPAAYAEVVERVRRESRPVYAVEREVLGANHAEMGAYLLRLWGLPDSVVEAVLRHHDPCGVPPGFSPTLAVHCADILDRELMVIHPEYFKPQLDPECLRRSGLEGRFEQWKEGGRAVCAGGDVDEA